MGEMCIRDSTYGFYAFEATCYGCVTLTDCYNLSVFRLQTETKFAGFVRINLEFRICFHFEIGNRLIFKIGYRSIDADAANALFARFQSVINFGLAITWPFGALRLKTKPEPLFVVLT